MGQYINWMKSAIIALIGAVFVQGQFVEEMGDEMMMEAEQQIVEIIQPDLEEELKKKKKRQRGFNLEKYEERAEKKMKK